MKSSVSSLTIKMQKTKKSIKKFKYDLPQVLGIQANFLGGMSAMPNRPTQFKTGLLPATWRGKLSGEDADL